MAFRFALQPVLLLRRSQQRQERLRLEAIGSELGQARLRLEQMKNASLEWGRQMQNSLGAGEPGALVQWDRWRGERFAAAVADQEVRVAHIEELRRTQLQTYMKARQRRELVESLLQRREDAYRLEERRRAQQRLDDIFLMRLNLSGDEEDLPRG